MDERNNAVINEIFDILHHISERIEKLEQAVNAPKEEESVQTATTPFDNDYIGNFIGDFSGTFTGCLNTATLGGKYFAFESQMSDEIIAIPNDITVFELKGSAGAKELRTPRLGTRGQIMIIINNTAKDVVVDNLTKLSAMASRIAAHDGTHWIITN